MRRLSIALAVAIAVGVCAGPAAQAPAAGPYAVLKTAKTGGLGGFDYVFADVAGRRIYIPRGAVQGATPTPARVSVWDLDTLKPIGEIPDIRGNGAVIDPKSAHGFTSSKPVAMFDTKTLKLIKMIDVQGQGDGILFDAFNERVWVFNHPTQDATVINAKDGTVVGTVALDGVPEESVSDGKGRIYVVIQDKANVAVVDAKALKTIAHYDFAEKASRCNGLALDAKNHVLFAACGQSGNPPVTPAKPMMVILSSIDGKIITTLPLAGGSDGAVFNPATMEVFSSHGNGTMTIVKEKSPTSFEVEQDLQTMVGAKCLALDTKTNRIVTMAAEYGPAPPPPPPDPNAPAGGARRGGRGPMLPDSFAVLLVGKAR